MGLGWAELTAAASLVPSAASEAFAAGEDQQALTLLRRARDGQPAQSAQWAYLERLTGLVLIHLQREVEGTFALDRADPLLEAFGWPTPTLDALAGD
ncbi:hypothetical protein EHF33_09720 [Deinococcus psychrotolerans]|uniref:Uncharacterized protein n=1 Tax=Deinococcus psychrotolerans TaxID=2489213 RepID=A0A3G8YMS9_9DEIO|nr:hypothetical protein EHF33_09720 [Deinococcus psychrotolerans]